MNSGDAKKAKLAVEYDELNPSTNFRCGNNMFSDLEWDFNGVVDAGTLSGRRLVLSFDRFKHKPELLEVIKWFAVDQLINNRFTTVKRNFDGLIMFIKFVDIEIPSLETFFDIDEEVLSLYFRYLLTTKGEVTGKPLSRAAIKKGAFVIKEILTIGYVRGWDVPSDVSFVHLMYENMILQNQSLKQSEALSKKKIEDKVIDQNLIDKVLNIAINDLNDNKNIITAASIVISTQLGLRLNELLTLKVGCIRTVNGERMIRYETRKLEASSRTVSYPANELVALAIRRLTEYSLPLRKKSGFKELFLNEDYYSKGHPVVIVDQSNFNKNNLKPWFKKHHLTYEDGSLLDFTSHTFRHTFATYALSGGASIESISKIMNHKSIRGTEHYTHLLLDDVKNRFAEIMSEESILAGNKAPKIKKRLKKDNPFKGKTVKDVDKIKTSMKVQELPHGFCFHHPMRHDPCEGDGVCLGCDNFITTPEFLDGHKERLDRVRETLRDASSNGPFEDKMKHIELNLVKLINELESQMESSKQWFEPN